MSKIRPRKRKITQIQIQLKMWRRIQMKQRQWQKTRQLHWHKWIQVQVRKLTALKIPYHKFSMKSTWTLIPARPCQKTSQVPNRALLANIWRSWKSRRRSRNERLRSKNGLKICRNMEWVCCHKDQMVMHRHKKIRKRGAYWLAYKPKLTKKWKINKLYS